MKKINQEIFSAINKFSSFVSHELKNSITVIKNAVYCLENSEKNYNKKQREMLLFLNKEVDRTYSKIVSLLDDTRVKYLNMQIVDIGEFVHKILLEVKDKKFKFNVNIRDNVKASVDKNRFRQVILIIIDNAKGAMPNGGNISIGVYSLKYKVVVDIKDYGCGMNKETLKKCFNPLFTTKRFQLGMSLAVAKHIILMLGGKIEVKSLINKGTKFVIDLPKA
ncbi:MAG: HAMP domain-containing histidine kinase [Endomicrobium sp.]|jgi:signal transduction histidine kinase|uniref:sensor histidine kinase n=1 Tax=Candidatus Endomicrobiellum cubanum TaxID=3242325 RepID=UPI00283165A0|nr:HAMP domain-containing histidine kinase [Endomicrobium sp.]